MGISKREKRLKIFRYGAQAAAKYRNGDASLYFCPLCRLGYDETSAINGELTLEDIPPKSSGGKPIVLTCRKCNSRAGDTIDAALANKKELLDFDKIVTGQKKGTASGVTFTIEDENIQMKCCVQSESSFDIKPVEKANAPATLDNYRKYLENISNRTVDFKFGLSKTLKYDQRLAKLSYLKSAFLILFALLGYRYVFDERLDVVRKQIQNPHDDIIGTKFWIESEQIPTKKIMKLNDPFLMLLVSFPGIGVILPHLGFKDDTYRSLSSHWGKNERVNIEATPLTDWPDKLQMTLDVQRSQD